MIKDVIDMALTQVILKIENRIKPPTNKKKLEQKRHVMKIEIKGFIEIIACDLKKITFLE